MSYRLYLKRLRRARQQLKRQRHALVALELEGIVTLTLNSVTQSLTLALQPEAQNDLERVWESGSRKRKRASK